MSTDSKEQWSNYWRQGHLTSLPYGFASNYEGEFLQFWNSQLALLKAGDRVLDACSGNGSIALLAQAYSDQHGLGLQVKAVDAADIDVTALIEKKPEFASQIQAIEFIPNTLFEDLSEEAESADLVMSQYGIEYTDWKISAKKIYRLLKPGGYFSLVCHAVDSKVMTQMEIQQRDFARLSDVGIFADSIDSGRTGISQRDFVKRLDDALDTIYAMFKENRTSDVLSNVGRELEQILRLAQKDFSSGFQSFVRFQQGISISYFTASDVAALSQRLKQCPDWFVNFIQEGLDLIQTGDIHYHTGELAGKYYQFRKPG